MNRIQRLFRSIFSMYVGLLELNYAMGQATKSMQRLGDVAHRLKEKGL